MTNRHLMETQNLVISFDYSWFLAKNLAYAECRIMKFHYRNSSTVTSLAKEKSHVTIFFQKQDTTLSSLCLWNQSSAESVISNSLAQQNFCLQWPLIGMAIPRKISLLNQGIKEWQFKVYIFWEGHKILQNLPLTFDCMYYSERKISQNFMAFSEYMNFTLFCRLIS